MPGAFSTGTGTRHAHSGATFSAWFTASAWPLAVPGSCPFLEPPLLLAVLALLLSLPRPTTPNIYDFEELYYACTAGKYAAGVEAFDTGVLPREDSAIEWTHPPLAKLLIGGGILVAGDNPLGWRWVNALFGAVGVGIA